MATAKSKAQCFICNKEKTTYICRGCSKDFCFDHLTEHRQILGKQLDEIECDRDQFQQIIFEQKQNPHNSALIGQINQWEQNSILKIQQTAEECREMLMKHADKHISGIEKKFKQFTEQLKHIRQENELNEIDLNHLKSKLIQLTQEFIKPSHISIEQDSSSSAFINKISVITLSDISPSVLGQIKSKQKWKQHAITIAGGFGQGNQLNQLSYPHGIFIDNDKTIYIADSYNHRIVNWKCGENKGQVIAGGNRKGNRNDLLYCPTDLIIDKQNNSLIISDHHNRRVIRWSTQNQTNQQILISDIDCARVTMDRNGFIYVCDHVKNEVRRWKEGETNGIIVAGGNGKGDHLNQLNRPSFIFIDENYSVYVSDRGNHRVMKWRKNANEGIVVAGGNGQGNSLNQLSSPQGVIVDHLGQTYVADHANHRVVRWCQGSAEGSIVVGGNGEGKQSNQLLCPTGLLFDVEGNLYVSDYGNHRIQKFDVDYD